MFFNDSDIDTVFDYGDYVNSAQLQILADELTNDPTGMNYPGGTQATVDAINAKTNKLGIVLPNKLLLWSIGSGRLKRIKDAINHADDVIASIAEASYILIQRESGVLDLRDPNQLGAIAALVSFGILTNPEKIELEDLSRTPTSRADELGLSKVRFGDIERARQL